MNKENAKDYLPFVHALADGKTLQHKPNGNKWFDCDPCYFNLPPEDYRIKPEPRTFDLFYHKTTDTVVTAREYTELGSLPDWERITVQEVLE
jgi:hypothetical protein